MAQAKRIVVSVPQDLLDALDALLAPDKGNRSALVREALRLLVRQRQRIRAVQDRLRRGYERMGPLNRRLAEEGLGEDFDSLASYERILGERESV